MSEQEHETKADDWEVVADGEPSLEDYPPSTHDAEGNQLLDAFGAPLRLPVQVIDGVRDSRRR